MQSRSFIIKRFELGPLAQWGFIAGVLVACLPAFACSWFFFSLVNSAREVIGGWTDVGFEFLGQRISFDLVETLSLQELYLTLGSLAGLGVFGVLFLALAVAALLGLFGAAVLTVLGLFYNTTGRVRVQVEEVGPDAASA